MKYFVYLVEKTVALLLKLYWGKLELLLYAHIPFSFKLLVFFYDPGLSARSCLSHVDCPGDQLCGKFEENGKISKVNRILMSK